MHYDTKNSKVLQALEQTIKVAVKKVGGTKENDICKYIPVSKGGYISGGAHNRDSVYAWDGDDHIVIMKGEYVLTTASVTYLFGNGDNYFGAQVLSLMMHWGHAMKHLHQIQSGKHYAEEPKVDEDEEE